MMGKFLIAAIVVTLVIGGAATHRVSADVGETQLCISGPADTATGNVPTGTNDYDGQVFIADTSYNISGVKGSWFGWGDAALMTVYLVDVQFVGGGYRPDIGSVLASVDVDLSTLPLYGASNTFSCDPTIRPEQIAEFSSPVSLVAGTRYAIILKYKSGTLSAGDTVAWPYTLPAPATPEYSDASTLFAMECDPPIACNAATPATWDAPNTCWNCAYELALYDDILDIAGGKKTVDSWIDSVLDTLNLNSDFGRLLIGSAVILFFFIAIVLMKIPFIFAAGVAMMIAGAATLATLFSVTLMLSGLAVVGVAAMILLFGILQGGKSDG